MRLRARGQDLTLLVLLAGLAFAVRAVPVVRGSGLDGLLGYDDGVYFGAAIALVHGQLPYRDVLLLHPPGIVLLLAPFALLGGLIGDPAAMALARVVVMALGALNTVLAGLVAGRYGRLAGLLAAALYATWHVAVVGERTTDLHAPQHTVILLALLVLAHPGRVRWRRAAAAGLLVGLAMTVQLWQGATMLVLAWWAGVRAPVGVPRIVPAVALIAGAAVPFVIVCLPFFAAAPEAMTAQVLLDQLGRPHTGIGIVDRLLALEGATIRSSLPQALRPVVPVPALLLALAGLVLFLVTAWLRPWARPWVVLVFIQASIVLSTPSFFVDYPTFLAPAATVALGTGLALVIERLRRRGVPRRMLAGGVVVGIVAIAAVSVVTPRGERLPIDQLRADVADARCVSADSATLLVLTGALRRNAEARCPIVVDPTGVAYDADRGRRYARGPDWRQEAPGYQRAMAEWYTSGDAALFVRLRADDLTGETREAIRRELPHALTRGDVVVRLRDR